MSSAVLISVEDWSNDKTMLIKWQNTFLWRIIEWYLALQICVLVDKSWVLDKKCRPSLTSIIDSGVIHIYIYIYVLLFFNYYHSKWTGAIAEKIVQYIFTGLIPETNQRTRFSVTLVSCDVALVWPFLYFLVFSFSEKVMGIMSIHVCDKAYWLLKLLQSKVSQSVFCDRVMPWKCQ